MLDPALVLWLRAKLPELVRPLLDRLVDERIKKLPLPSVTVIGGGGGAGGGVTIHRQLAGLDADDHPQYLTAPRADTRYEPMGSVTSAIAAHVALADPHPAYTTLSEAAAAAPVQSVASRTGAVTLDAGDIAGLGNAALLNVGTVTGTVAAGNHQHTGVYESAGAVAAHVALADPHPQYHNDARGDARYVPASGGIFTGHLSIGGRVATNVNGMRYLGAAWAYIDCESSHVAYYKKAGGFGYYWRVSDDGTTAGANAQELFSVTETQITARRGVSVVVAGVNQLVVGYDVSNYGAVNVTSSGVMQLGSSTNRLTWGGARTPASAGAVGVAGEMCWDANYLYVCVAANTWKRVALSEW